MNDDTFSRNEERMVQFHRSNDSYKPRETASGLANIVGARLANDATDKTQDRIVEILQNAQDEDEVLSNLHELGGYAQRDLVAALIRVQSVTAIRVAELERDLADLRAAQSAPPTVAHPYRSGPQCPAVPASSPVVASTAAERVEGRPGALRRVCGALARSWVFLVCAACCGVLAWFGRFALPVLVIYAAMAALNTAAAAAFAWSRP